MKANKTQARRSVDILGKVAKKAMQAQHQLSHGKGPDPREVKLPVNFVRAWYYLLSSMLNMTWTSDANERALKYARRFERELDAGHDIVFGGENLGRRLLEVRAVLPAELPALLIRRVIEGVDGNNPSTEKACWDYFGKLVSLETAPNTSYQNPILTRAKEMNLARDPLNRSHQFSASLLLEEVEALQHHMSGQQQILAELLNVFPFKSGGSSFYDRFQHRAMRDVMDLVQSKRRSLHDLRDKTNRLVSSVRIIQARNPGVLWHTKLPTNPMTTRRVYKTAGIAQFQKLFLTRAEQGEYRKK